MIRRLTASRVVAAGILALLASPFATALAQSPATAAPQRASTAAAPKPLNLEDYGAWKRIGNVGLSSDGKWMTYAYTPNDGEGALFIAALDSAVRHEIPRGTGAALSDNSRWVAYFFDPPSAGRGGRGAAAPAGGGRGRGATPQAAETPQAQTRTFEIPACGTVLATERNEETERFFDDSEALFYDGVDELIARVRELLHEPMRAQAMAEAGLKRVLRDRLPVEVRLVRKLEIVRVRIDRVALVATNI